MIEILQVRGEAYSSWSEKNVNDSHHSIMSATESAGWKSVDGEANRWNSTPAQLEGGWHCGKAEDGSG
jgi:hypothetical protein